jgi:hypothetical protein
MHDPDPAFTTIPPLPRISITLGTSLTAGPGAKPGEPADRGAYHFRDRNIDMAFTPFSIGILGHWDPPK